MKNFFIDVLLALMFACACSCSSGTVKIKQGINNGRLAEPVTVRVVKVEYTENAAENSLVGTVKPSKSAIIMSAYPGKLTGLRVRKGQRLQAGTPIATVDVQSVKSSYEAAKAIFEQASDAYERARKVYDKGGISEIKMIDIRTSLSKAEATYKAAVRALDDCTLKAPYGGVVEEIFTHEGMDLQIGSPVIKMLDTSDVEIHASVPENEYAAYVQGMPVRIEVPAVGEIFDGVLVTKGLEASRITCSYECTFKITSPHGTSGVMPGMICKVHVPSGNGRAIVIPASAVMVDAEGRYVWCCNDGTVSRRYIDVDGFFGNGVIAGSGLEEGDMLVIEGSRKISDGMTGIRTVY